MNVEVRVSEPESHAQFAEDRILAEIFGDRAEGCCVEVGANDGRTGSASYLFEKRGWRCLLVEPIPALVEEIHKHRACRVVNCAASSSEGEAKFFVAEGVEAVSGLDLTPDRMEWIRRVGGTIKEITVRTATLDSLLQEAGFTELEFVTIDVEGHELSVLEGFDLETYRPRIVIIEDNSVNGNLSVARHMVDHGYVHFRRTGVNEWYAHASDAELVKPQEIRKFERAKQIELWDRRRKQLVTRIATHGGRYFPESTRRRMRDVYEAALGKRR
ncbi:MAG TPA: FkbM family methyltransferase [Solirubrobacteraceae bacterium]|jgi:FkbM family methyltransferase|nr:FkbM family methyltransferase [Solirubrobacteraceae bacterium]